MSFPVSILIPTKNAGDLFDDVLAGLKNQDFPGEKELVVIDSGSTDGTLAAARRAGARILSVAPRDFNHGRTRDDGIRSCQGEIVVLLTQDAVPGDCHLVAQLAAAFRDPKVAGAYARQVPRPEADTITRRNLECWLTGSTQPRVRYISDWYAYLSFSPMEHYVFCNFDNVCSAVRKSVWKLVPFGEHDFGEDIEWAKNVLEDGWKIVYQPSAFVVHSHERSLAYEYRRTFVCHRKLYDLFGIWARPTLWNLWVCVFRLSLQDLWYVCRHQAGIRRRLAIMARVPLLSFATLYGQYRGARDARLHLQKKVAGV